MEIKIIRKKELSVLLESDWFREANQWPVSRARAASTLNSPLAKEEDVVLTFGVKGGKLVGYMGAFPDRLLVGKEKMEMAWISCFWVDETAENKGILALALLRNLQKAWKNRLIVTDLSPKAEAFFSSSKQFVLWEKYRGKRCYMRLNLHQLLPARFPNSKPLLPVFLLIDVVGNIFLDLKNKIFYYNKNLKNNIEENLFGDKTLEQYILEKQKSESVQRTLSEMKWMHNFPWIKSDEATEANKNKYYFSSFDKNFKRKNIVFKKETGEILGVLDVLIHKGQMKIPFGYFESGAEKIIGIYLRNFIINEKINYITIYNEKIIKLIEESTSMSWLARDFSRPYYIHKKFLKELKNHIPVFQDGDGECGFT